MAKKSFKLVKASAALAVTAAALTPVMAAEASTSVVELKAEVVLGGKFKEALALNTPAGVQITWGKHLVTAINTWQTVKGQGSDGKTYIKKLYARNYPLYVLDQDLGEVEAGSELEKPSIRVMYRDGKVYTQAPERFTMSSNYNTKDLGKQEVLISYNHNGNRITKMLSYTVVKTETEIEELKAVSSKALEVKFNNEVDTSKAQFEVKKNGVKINTSAISFDAAKKVATIELASKVTAGEYTVSVTGVEDKTLTKSVQAQDERVAKIEVLATEAPLYDVDVNGNGDLKVGYQVLNQYGENITRTTSLTTSANNVSVDPITGVVTITGDYNTTINKVATFTLIHAPSATTATATVTAVAEAKVADVAFKGLYNKDGKALLETSNLGSDLYYAELEVKDQYGKVITNAAKINAELLLAESNPTVVDAAGSVSVMTVDGKERVFIALTAPGTGIKAGQNILTAIAKATGKAATYSVVVGESTRAENVSVSAPALALASENFDIPVTVTDKEGKLITDVAVLKDATRGVRVTLDGADVTSSLFAKDGQVYAKSGSLTEGFKTIVVISNASQKVATQTIQVREAAKPVVITGLKSTFSTTIKAEDSKAITSSDVVVEDQYGRAMSTTALDAWLAANAGNDIVVSENVTSAIVSLSEASVKDGVEVVAGTANGTETLTLTLKVAGNALLSSAKNVSFRVTDGTEYKSYEVKEIGTVYDELAAGGTNDDAYDKEIEVYGVLADGSKVKLSNGEFAVTSSNTAVNADVATDKTLNVDSALTVYGDKDTAVIPVTVTINATGQQFTQNVTFSKVAPKVEAVKVATAADAKALEIVEVSGSTFNKASLNTASSYKVFVTDQYGVTVKATEDTGAVTFLDGSSVVAPTLTVVPVKGSVTITGNGTASAAVSGIDAGEEFNATLTYVNGKAVTVKAVKAN